MMRMIHIGLIFSLLSFPLIGCGGGLTSATDKGITTNVTVDPLSIKTASLYGNEKIVATFSCKSGDLFEVECKIKKVKITLNGYSYEYPLNLILKHGESRTVDIDVFTNSDREMPPFSYLRDVNPSTSNSGWTVYSEIIGSIGSNLIATGIETCIADPKTGEQKCTSVFSYSGTLSEHTPGTVKITDGSQNLEETTFGVLTGSGSGIINGNSISLTFASGPKKGSLISAMYLSVLNPLLNIPSGKDLKIVYNDLVLNQLSNLLIDSTGNTYAIILDKTITVFRPLGFRNAPLVATYSGEPFNAYGGEKIGKGDGISKTFTLKTKYAPILKGSLKVFTETQPATILFFNEYTGEVSFSFEKAPTDTENIKASYIITRVNMPISISFISETGNDTISLPLEVSRP